MTGQWAVATFSCQNSQRSFAIALAVNDELPVVPVNPDALLPLYGRPRVASSDPVVVLPPGSRLGMWSNLALRRACLSALARSQAAPCSKSPALRPLGLVPSRLMAGAAPKGTPASHEEQSKWVKEHVKDVSSG